MDTCDNCGGDLTVMESWVTVGENPPQRRGDVGVCDDCGRRYQRPDEGSPWQHEEVPQPPR